MRFLRYLVLAVFFAGTLVPSLAHAQASRSFIESIVPQTGTCTCQNVQIEGTGETAPSAPSYGCILDTVQRAINALVFIGVIVVILCIVYAGFLFMTAGGSTEALIRGRRVITNSILGLIIILFSWVTIDFIMKFVYKPDAVISGSAQLGPWNAIWSASEESKCLVVRNPVPVTTGVVDFIRGITGGLPQIGTARTPCIDSHPGCGVPAIMSQGLNENQARAMSCIAMTESSGDPTQVSNTGACGLFQITTRPGNWSIPRYHGPGCSTSTSCHDVRCNLQTAVLLFRDRGYQPWTGVDPRTGRHWNPNAVACVNQYDPGGSSRR